MANFNSNLIKVTPIEAPICCTCWKRRAVNSVRVGCTDLTRPLCQQCTNYVITCFSLRANGIVPSPMPFDWRAAFRGGTIE